MDNEETDWTSEVQQVLAKSGDSLDSAREMIGQLVNDHRDQAKPGVVIDLLIKHAMATAQLAHAAIALRGQIIAEGGALLDEEIGQLAERFFRGRER